MRNEEWLREWEPTSPYTWAERSSRSAWPPLHAALRRAGRNGSMLPFMIAYGGRLVGQVNASNVVRGVLRSCSIGYWIDAAVAGRGITPTAVALLVDHCFAAAGLHRVQIDIRPENVASLRVVEKLGLRQEGGWSASSTSTAPGATICRSRSPSKSLPAGRCSADWAATRLRRAVSRL